VTDTQENSKITKVLLGICGSIAAYKACDLIRSLRANNCEVKCVLTGAGQNFITPLTLQTLSGQQVYTEMFADCSYDPCHISLAEYADLIVIAPASADIIARAACGLADDLLSSVLLSTKTKVLLCPAMHTNMWTHPATQKNIRQLKALGYHVLGPVKGKLVSGEGQGRLSPIEDIVKKILDLTSK
jgi:phosphopantothenoylcysteine synthetase/decarboxylase